MKRRTELTRGGPLRFHMKLRAQGVLEKQAGSGHAVTVTWGVLSGDLQSLTSTL